MKQLLLDPRVVAQIDNAILVPGPVHKCSHNPLLVEDRPWEVRFDNLYPNIVYDPTDRLYKVWYNPFIVDGAVADTPDEKKSATKYYWTPNREAAVCYAFSEDGIHWTKPELGLIEYNGSTRNNIVKRNTHGAGVFYDPADELAKRFKMLTTLDDTKGPLGVAFSSDGVHWGESVPCPSAAARGDTHNNAFRDPATGKFVAFTRLWDGHRIVGRTESDDFVNWTPAEPVLRALPERPETEPYAMIAFPYEGVYLGLLMAYDTRADKVGCELAFSSDSRKWDWITPGRTLIPFGPKGACDHSCIYAAAHPIIDQDEVRIYYAGNDAGHYAFRNGYLCLCEMERDRFAGFTPVSHGALARIVTNECSCSGHELRISADIREGGSLTVTALDPAGQSLNVSQPVTTSGTDIPLTWRGPSELWSSPQLRLQFDLRMATVYSFRFVETPSTRGHRNE